MTGSRTRYWVLQGHAFVGTASQYVVHTLDAVRASEARLAAGVWPLVQRDMEARAHAQAAAKAREMEGDLRGFFCWWTADQPSPVGAPCPYCREELRRRAAELMGKGA